MNKIEQATKQIPEHNWAELVLTIIDEAYSRFMICESESDFCIQYSTGFCIVFGGHNRIRWTAEFGFQAERSHCSKRFLELWDEKYG